MAASSSTFPLFSSLPPELRNRIWQDALPDKDGPALYPYKRGCWSPRHLLESDEGYDPNDKDNVDLEFRHDLLDYVQVKVPLVFVSREARGIALAWVREQGIEMRFREEAQCHIFARPFDPVRDALYIAPDKLNDFCLELYDRMSEPDISELIVSIGPDLTRFAMPEALLWSERNMMPQIFEFFSRLAKLFIIVDAQPDFEDNDIKVQRRWELESTQGRAFVWNHENGGFDLGDGEDINDEVLYKKIEEASKGLGEILVGNLTRTFEIRPVVAVRR
ncbi:hypothetical protein TOPH_06261 [Tolypocladium ophioglossoides CBS 100239]|uniref:2EXR domain-containing protein n=1 Tax=Tolypocladium ophioglossoides (strain CBS 100239) TaxID=1163406 RepID=A0A0L0N4R7_TOLOC|nr:hypothetical protein TOPH_06261 [Tolypocladium ophioglossoides CBS 100239]